MKQFARESRIIRASKESLTTKFEDWYERDIFPGISTGLKILRTEYLVHLFVHIPDASPNDLYSDMMDNGLTLSQQAGMAVSSYAKILACPVGYAPECPESYEGLVEGSIVSLSDDFNDFSFNQAHIEWQRRMQGEQVAEGEMEAEPERFVGVLSEWRRRYAFNLDQATRNRDDDQFLFLIPYAKIKAEVTKEWVLKNFSELPDIKPEKKVKPRKGSAIITDLDHLASLG